MSQRLGIRSKQCYTDVDPSLFDHHAQVLTRSKRDRIDMSLASGQFSLNGNVWR
jgi:hypothetical protein